MYIGTKLTSRVLLPYVNLLFYSFINVDSRSLVLKNDVLWQSEHKETSPRKSNFLTTTSRQSTDKQDSTFSGVTTTSSSSRIQEFLNAFRRPLSSRDTNDLDSTSDYKCKRQNPTKHRHRLRRYVLQGSNIRKADIKWAIAVFSQKLPHAIQIDKLQKAFRTWAAHCILTFMYESDLSKADIVIKFVTGKHGDNQPFDNAGNILAHASFPSTGNYIHFDEDENWVPEGKGGVSLLSVAIHEIGHALGLRHSSVFDSVMYPLLTNGKNTLDNDDIKGIQKLYGKCTIQNLDAVVTSKVGNGFTNRALVFKNEWVWSVDTSNGDIVPGYPKIIGGMYNRELYHKHPFKVVLYEEGYNSYLFMHKDGYVTLHDVKGFPVDHKYTYDSRNSYFRGFLSSTVGPPDAGFVDPDNNDIYHFFIGQQYYKFDMSLRQVLAGYPKPIKTELPDIPGDLDAAYYDYAAKTYYFIKANKYYKFIKYQSKFVYQSVGVLTDIFKNICPV